MSSSGYVPLCSFVLKAVGVPVCAAKLLSRSPAQAAAVLEARDSPPLSICLNRSSSPSLLSSDLSMGDRAITLRFQCDAHLRLRSSTLLSHVRRACLLARILILSCSRTIFAVGLCT
ncbi:hypothetical protein B0H14DRAFT_3048036 [Mycena olivaceomarginata]|nr:hypothetical protein B0H14DRAFT_3048036 [Mycena olivaceomarginata]